MLVLSRHKDQRIMIGNDIILTIVDIRADKVRIGVDAPQNLPVHREEVYNAIKKEIEKGTSGKEIVNKKMFNSLKERIEYQKQQNQ